MGNRPSFMLQDEEIKLISEETGFSSAQIERLYSRFTALDKSGNGSLSRQDCLAIPELAINPLCDRIVHMFFIDCDEDHERINFRQFMKVLATFRSSHKSSPRQDSLNQQQAQAYLKQAPLLFDAIPMSQSGLGGGRHSRHSSYHDGFHDAHHNQNGHHSQHRTTNQHSVHYAASSTHLSQNGHHHHHHHHHHHSHNAAGGGSFSNGLHHQAGHHNGSHEKLHAPLVDPDEPPNSRKQKLYFMFKIYDVNNDDLLDLQDLEAILRLMVGTYVDEARLRRIAERTLREADKNCDGFIGFEEFSDLFNRQDIDESMRVKFGSCSS